jgi:hypothetical protein
MYVLLWPSRASTQNVPCGGTTSLAVPVGLWFLRGGGGEVVGLLSETLATALPFHTKKTLKCITDILY